MCFLLSLVLAIPLTFLYVVFLYSHSIKNILLVPIRIPLEHMRYIEVIFQYITWKFSIYLSVFCFSFNSVMVKKYILHVSYSIIQLKFVLWPRKLSVLVNMSCSFKEKFVFSSFEIQILSQLGQIGRNSSSDLVLQLC